MANKNAVATISADDLLQLQKRAEILSSEKLVIVTGPSFGTVVKYLLLGAALGAGAVVLLREKSASETPAIGEAAVDRRTFTARARTTLNRAKGIASRARDAAQIVAEAARPAIEEAVVQGKVTADQVRRELETEISKEEA